ncbi:uncharacterized protein N7529_008337 [Penicillium soppii]|uniref:uncharacterized protein n=1 Tax=Penicillium soppii TaxID=69789 RepID=UPI002547D79C|nr:uncharacterized protein N7529_008337 [Penicillium soppii]KAJ5861027.1 hypothetical protein N7529_008337 [Penicillium soppii]
MHFSKSTLLIVAFMFALSGAAPTQSTGRSKNIYRDVTAAYDHASDQGAVAGRDISAQYDHASTQYGYSDLAATAQYDH